MVCALAFDCANKVVTIAPLTIAAVRAVVTTTDFTRIAALLPFAWCRIALLLLLSMLNIVRRIVRRAEATCAALNGGPLLVN